MDVGDYFSRQRSIPDWHQPLLEAQTALVLGVGGIGCSVARNLCRLGVQEVIIVDNDTVSASNINRQVLYSATDVGRSKVSAALDGLKPHCIRTKLTGVECNAVKEWSKIVELAKRSNVVFNGIDVGEYFDYAVTSLCVTLGVSYVAASSYGHTAVVDCYPPPLLPRDGPCWACNNSPSVKDILLELTPIEITSVSSLSFLSEDSHMPATQDVGSSVLVATLAATLATGSWVNSLHGYKLPHWTTCDFTSLSMTSFRVERSPSCLICNQAPRYSPIVLDVYFGREKVPLSRVPGATLTISPADSQDSHMPATQDVGSSVLVATLAATLATGSWVNSLHGYKLPHWTTCDFTSLSMTAFRVERSPSCLICNQAPRYSPIVLDVYFGREKVPLSRVPGATLTIVPADSQAAMESEVVLKRLEKSYPHVGSDSESSAAVFLPVVPATDPLTGEMTVTKGEVPELLLEPLLKTADGSICAIVSGQRSAILPTHKGCYRLKGCGCYLDREGSRFSFPAFPVEKIEGTEGKWEVRGCCFKHTAHNEQHMCDVIASVLEKEEMAVGNRSLCVWHYSIPGEPVDVVPKYCGVFETLGERRLSSDLLCGLSLLLPHLLPSLSLSSALALFPPERISHSANDQPSVLPTWSACCSGGQDKKQEPINLCHTPLMETPPTLVPPDSLPTLLLGEWCRCVHSLRDNLLPLSQELLCSYGSALATLYWRLGWEVGVVSRILATNGINWGYFFDHNPFEPHCNQHPNNFVVLPPGYKSLLAPVDFDLAFRAGRFVSPYTGTNDPSLFQSWLESGQSEMERALGGETANTGVQGNCTQGHLSPSHSVLEWALRDTLVCGYREALSTPQRTPPLLPISLRRTVDCLIRLALIMSSTTF